MYGRTFSAFLPIPSLFLSLFLKNVLFLRFPLISLSWYEKDMYVAMLDYGMAIWELYKLYIATNFIHSIFIHYLPKIVCGYTGVGI